MDRGQFDALARLLSSRKSRRSALGIVLGALALGHEPGEIVAKGKGKGRKKGRRRCYPGTSCLPGQGQDNAGCDFAGSLAFFELAAQGSNLSHANFTDAQMAGANFQGSDLGEACLVGANLLDAVIDNSTNLKDAVFCNTLMPDGSLNNQNCGKGTRCCPAPIPEQCVGEACAPACIGAPNAPCSFNVPYGGCCPGLRCVPSSTQPVELTCQAPCGDDGSCRARFGTPWRCASEPVICRYIGGECCQHI